MPCARQAITRDANEVILCRQTFIRRVSLFLPAQLPLSNVVCVRCSTLRPPRPRTVVLRLVGIGSGSVGWTGIAGAAGCESCCSSRRCSESLKEVPTYRRCFRIIQRAPCRASTAIHLYNMYIVRLRFAMSPPNILTVHPPPTAPRGRCVGRVRQSSKITPPSLLAALNTHPSTIYLQRPRAYARCSVRRRPRATTLHCRRRTTVVPPVIPHGPPACSSFMNSVLDAKRLLNNIV